MIGALRQRLAEADLRGLPGRVWAHLEGVDWRHVFSRDNLRFWLSWGGLQEASRRHSVVIFSVLVAFIPALPRMPLAGPISMDDLLPGVAALYGLLAWRWGHLRLRVPLIGWLMAAVAVSSLLPVIGLGIYGTLLAGPVRWAEALVLIVLTYSMLRTRRDGIVFLLAVAASVSFQAAFGMAAELLNWSGGNGYVGIERFRGYESIAGLFPGRITGTLAMPATFVAAFLAGGLPVVTAIGLEKAVRHRWIAWGAAALVAMAVFFTFSRISLVAGLGFAFIVLMVRAPWKVWIPLVLITLLVVFVSPMRDRLLHDSNDRQQLWSAAASVVRDHPFFGVGAGRYLHYLPFYENTPYGIAMTTAHNSVLLAWAEQGLLVGLFLAAAIVCVFLPGIRAVMRKDSALVGAVCGWGAFTMCGMFANLFFIPSVALTMWCLAAAAAALAAAGPPLDPATEPRDLHAAPVSPVDAADEVAEQAA